MVEKIFAARRPEWLYQSGGARQTRTQTRLYARGYFYGDKPSGSNYSFNRVEDFAESVAMYVGWGNDNPLRDQAHARISRYELANGEVDPFFRTKDNWAEYRKYFYPDGGDYSKSKRWMFVEGLVKRN